LNGKHYDYQLYFGYLRIDVIFVYSEEDLEPTDMQGNEKLIFARQSQDLNEFFPLLVVRHPLSINFSHFDHLL
jgi:hypothetical protein